MHQVLDRLEGARNPLPSSTDKFYVLIETTGSNESYDRYILEIYAATEMLIFAVLNHCSYFVYGEILDFKIPGLPDALIAVYLGLDLTDLIHFDFVKIQKYFGFLQGEAWGLPTSLPRKWLDFRWSNCTRLEPSILILADTWGFPFWFKTF